MQRLGKGLQWEPRCLLLLLGGCSPCVPTDGGHCLHPTCEQGFVGSFIPPPPKTPPDPLAWKSRDILRTCWEALKLKAQVEREAAGCQSGGSPPWSPPVSALKLCLQAGGLGQSSQLFGLAALLLPGNRGRGGASRQLMGCPSQCVYPIAGGCTLTPPVPTGCLPAAVPTWGSLFCTVEQHGQNRVSSPQPPLSGEFILC